MKEKVRAVFGIVRKPMKPGTLRHGQHGQPQLWQKELLVLSPS